VSHGESLNFLQQYHQKNREVTWDIEPSLISIALEVLNHRSELESENIPRFSKDEIQHVCQRPSRISPSFHLDAKGRREFPDRSILPYFGNEAVQQIDGQDGVPDWVSPDSRNAWQSALEEVVGPLIEQIDMGLSMNALHVPTYRGRPKRHYGPDDALTPLLERYQEFEVEAEGMTGDVKRDYIGKWLEAFEIGSSLHVVTVGPDLYEAYVERDGAKRYLADLGSGSAQLLPLIINFATRQSSLVIVEEPEANLHPNLQARLADFFVEMIDQGMQVIIETHSEYLTRRLQYLVARGECEPDQAGILYLRSEDDDAVSEKTPKVKEITIDGYGQLSQPFGPGFFDQATDLMMDLFKYGQKN
jgi:hypothetical protein